MAHNNFKNNATTSFVPGEWEKWVEVAGQLVREKDTNFRAQLDAVVNALLEKYEGITRESLLPVESRICRELDEAIGRLREELKNAHAAVCREIITAIEDFKAARECEDRFVIAVFGRVNAGKSALANHMAGVDFLAQSSVRSECFVGSETVDRLPEAATECTRDFQGFRLPGILWIDCPGAGSITEANERLARRLVARADVVIFVTSSDAPMTESDAVQLSRLVQSSGNELFAGLVVITKVDEPDWDSGFSSVKARPQDALAVAEQIAWTREQMASHGLSMMTERDPVAVSVYVARQAIGVDCETGRRGCRARGNTKPSQQLYEASGIPQLLETLTGILCQQGKVLKNKWRKKRLNILRSEITDRVNPARAELKNLQMRLTDIRTQCHRKLKTLAPVVSNKVRASITHKIKKHSGHGMCHTSIARSDVQDLLRKTALPIITEGLGALIENALPQLEAAVHQFIETINVDTQRRTRTISAWTKVPRSKSFCDYLYDFFLGWLFGPTSDYETVKVERTTTEGDAEYASRLAIEMEKITGNYIDAMLKVVEKSICGALMDDLGKIDGQLQALERLADLP